MDLLWDLELHKYWLINIDNNQNQEEEVKGEESLMKLYIQKPSIQSEVVLLELMNEIVKSFEFRKKKKRLDISTSIKGTASQASIILQKEQLTKVIYSLLFEVTRAWKEGETVKIDCFNWRVSTDEFIDYKPVLQSVATNLNNEISQYLFVCIQSPCLDSRWPAFLSLVEDADALMRLIGGRVAFSKNNQGYKSDDALDVDDSGDNLTPTICITTPFEVGKCVSYRDWAQDAVDEAVKAGETCKYETHENTSMFN